MSSWLWLSGALPTNRTSFWPPCWMTLLHPIPSHPIFLDWILLQNYLSPCFLSTAVVHTESLLSWAGAILPALMTFAFSSSASPFRAAYIHLHAPCPDAMEHTGIPDMLRLSHQSGPLRTQKPAWATCLWGIKQVLKENQEVSSESNSKEGRMTTTV